MGNTLGGGIGTLYRSGGTLTVSGSLSVYGNATIILDSTTGNVATSFSKLGRTSPATLVVVPQTGNLATTEAIYFTSNPGQTSGILGCWAVGAASGTDGSGDYLTTLSTTSGYRLTPCTYTDTNFTSPSGTSVESVNGTVNLSGTATVYAMKVGGTLSNTSTLTLNSGGMILNGGLVSGGTVNCGSQPALIYVGSSNPGTISSILKTSGGLVKFGPGTLVLTANNSGALTGNNNLISSGALTFKWRRVGLGRQQYDRCHRSFPGTPGKHQRGQQLSYAQRHGRGW